jgi:hypothetical protein
MYLALVANKPAVKRHTTLAKNLLTVMVDV